MDGLLTSYRLMLRLVAELIGHVRADPRLGCGVQGAQSEHLRAQGGDGPAVWVHRTAGAVVRRALQRQSGAADDPRARAVMRAMARRLKAGVRMVEAYLRRIVIMMALEIEPTLVDARRPLPDRPVHRAERSTYQPIRFVVLDESYSPYTGAVAARLRAAREARRQRRGTRALRAPNLGRLQHKLDLLAKIAANPLPCARRFAHYLARQREGVIVAPDLHYRPPGYLRRYWTTEPSLTFDLMGYEILQQSKARPPPQAPPRHRGPRITIL